TLMPIMVSESLMQDTNFKSILLEYVQAQGNHSPRYTVVDETGPDHDKQFTVAVYVGDECLGIGAGKNKKEAEQNAAQKALEQKFNA
ncbi:MAG: putative dsRNA-binding protein, partial [Candidatus Kapaibacterium sp.]